MTRPLKRLPEPRKVWEHNSYQGHTSMMRQNLLTIQSASTTSPETKKIATAMLDQCSLLTKSLKTRID